MNVKTAAGNIIITIPRPIGTGQACGHSHCPICQGIKRMQWQDRLGVRMLPVPYAHITFTVPHELNGLTRKNPAAMFNLLFQSAWQTIRKVCADKSNVGGLPGMTAVLHIPT